MNNYENRKNYNTKTKDIRVSIHLNIEGYSHTNDSIETNKHPIQSKMNKKKLSNIKI